MHIHYVFNIFLTQLLDDEDIIHGTIDNKLSIVEDDVLALIHHQGSVLISNTLVLIFFHLILFIVLIVFIEEVFLTFTYHPGHVITWCGLIQKSL
jgi:hypothetical protein